jgi:hypothetical protein
MNRRILFIGNKLAAGTAVAATLYRINSGRRSGRPVRPRLGAARDAGRPRAWPTRKATFWAIGLADDGGGTPRRRP